MLDPLGRKIYICRNDLLARPLALWNHVDVDFAEEVLTVSSASVPLLQAGNPVAQPSSGLAIVRATATLEPLKTDTCLSGKIQDRGIANNTSLGFKMHCFLCFSLQLKSRCPKGV